MPFIDVTDKRRQRVEFSSTLEKAVSGIKNVDTVIGGHTPAPVSWSDFTTYTEFYRDFRASAQASLKKGGVKRKRASHLQGER